MSNEIKTDLVWLDRFNKAKEDFKKEWLKNNPFPKNKLILHDKHIICNYNPIKEDFEFNIINTSQRISITPEEMFKIIDWVGNSIDKFLKSEKE